MAIERPEAIDDAAVRPAAQRRMAEGGFLASRGMRDHPARPVAWGGPAGEESCRPPLRQVDRGAAALRPDQAMRGRVGSAHGQPRKTQWRQAPPIRWETPRLGRQHLLLSRPQQADTADLAPFLASSARPLSGRSRRTPRWCRTTLGEPDPLLTIRSLPPLLWARVRSTTILGLAPAMRPSTRIPLHPERGVPRLLRQGSSPSGAKRRSRFERSRRARPKGGRQIFLADGEVHDLGTRGRSWIQFTRENGGVRRQAGRCCATPPPKDAISCTPIR